jgi:GT2 family glycosyltransferase
VSFVVPVRNGARWLDRVLTAIAAQADGRPFEVIVVDDASVDGSRAIAAAHRDVVVLDGHGRGVAAALNLALRRVTQPIVCQIDQDVIVEAGWAARITSMLDRYGAAACQGYYTTPDDARVWARVAGLDLAQRYARVHGVDVDQVCTGNSAYRTDALRDIGGFDESFGYACDNDMSYRLRRAGHRLVFCRAARGEHAWRETARGYFAQQYGFGYGRLDLVAKHPDRMLGDDTSGPGMIAHAGVMFGAWLVGATAVLSAVLGRGWRGLALLALGLVLGLAIERAVTGVRAALQSRDTAGLWFAPIHLVRDAAWASAIAVWTCRALLRRPRSPSHSMRADVRMPS